MAVNLIFLLKITLEIYEYFFAIIIFSEYFLKIIAMGFVIGSNTYLRLGWNMIDFVVVITRFQMIFI